MAYEGHIGKAQFDGEAEIFQGEVTNTRDVVTFKDDTGEVLRKEFQLLIDEHSAFCSERGEESDKPRSKAVFG